MPSFSVPSAAAVSLASLLISFVAIGISLISAYLTWRQTRASEAQALHARDGFELQRAQDAAAKQAASRANLTARLEGRDLRITNHGPSAARDVLVTLNGQPPAGNPVVYAGQNTDFPVVELAPTAMVDLRLWPHGPAGKAALSVRVTWTDDSQAEERAWGSVLSWP